MEAPPPAPSSRRRRRLLSASIRPRSSPPGVPTASPDAHPPTYPRAPSLPSGLAQLPGSRRACGLCHGPGRRLFGPLLLQPFYFDPARKTPPRADWRSGAGNRRRPISGRRPPGGEQKPVPAGLGRQTRELGGPRGRGSSSGCGSRRGLCLPAALCCGSPWGPALSSAPASASSLPGFPGCTPHPRGPYWAPSRRPPCSGSRRRRSCALCPASRVGLPVATKSVLAASVASFSRLHPGLCVFVPAPSSYLSKRAFLSFFQTPLGCTGISPGGEASAT